MKVHVSVAAGALALLAITAPAAAQGVGEGAREGAYEGGRAAGPVGAVVGGAVGAVTGGVNGALGLHHRRYYYHYPREARGSCESTTVHRQGVEGSKTVIRRRCY